MKKYSLALLCTLLCASSASATQFYYKYVFRSNHTILGDFTAEINPDNPYLENVEVGGFQLFNGRGTLIFNSGFDLLPWNDFIPANGSMKGLALEFNNDSGGSGGDQGFFLSEEEGAAFNDEESDFWLNDFQIRPTWRLSTTPFPNPPVKVPDTGSTLALLGVALTGLTAVKRLGAKQALR